MLTPIPLMIVRKKEELTFKFLLSTMMSRPRLLHVVLMTTYGIRRATLMCTKRYPLKVPGKSIEAPIKLLKRFTILLLNILTNLTLIKNLLLLVIVLVALLCRPQLRRLVVD